MLIPITNNKSVEPIGMESMRASAIHLHISERYVCATIGATDTSISLRRRAQGRGGGGPD
eukprot:1124101-Pyramimonas_sp.AAC.1